MKVDDVVSRLQACGLAEKEARAFVHLTRLGASKVTDLAKAAGLKRAETYQVLEKLQGRGLVEGTLSRPRQFVAADPERAIAILVEERSAQLKAVQSMEDELRERLARLGGVVAEKPGEAFRVLHERNQIVGQLSRTLRAAQREVCAVASSRSLFRLLLDEGLEAQFREAAGRGVQVRILTDVLEGQEDLLARLAGFADVRHLLVPRPLRFFIADEGEIVQYVTADPIAAGAKETALWIGARDHVQAQRAFFDDQWALAMTREARMEELATGRAPEQVQVVRGRLTRTEKEKEMLLRAAREVALVLDAAEAARLASSGLARVLQARVREGVRVRVLAPEGVDVPLAQATVRRTRDKAPLPVVLVDEAEALLVLRGKAQGDEAAARAEQGVWVSLLPSVERIWARFEKDWDEAPA